MMQLRDVLAPIDALFKLRQIEYVVIGGYAIAAWGQVRATRDVDLLCSARDLNSLILALKAADMRFEHRVGDPDDPISDVIRIELEATSEIYEVDVLSGIRGAPEGIFKRSRAVQIQDLVIPVASPEDTIILKLLGGSGRDLDDARSVLRTQKGRIDIPLVRQLCPPLCETILENLLRSTTTHS